MQENFESILGWRFQRSTVGAGSRLESTLFVGATVPMQDGFVRS